MHTFLAAVGFILLAALPAAGEARPNFVIIFTDDQGYGDLGCFGSVNVSTPRIDKMAAEGAKLTSFYMAAPYCTPSRAALMTGSYPKRVGMGGGVCLSADPKGLNPEEVTIAEVLKSAGYRTGIFGKWHLGDQPEFLPTKQGFDEFFGLPYSHDIHPYNPKGNRKFPPLPLLEGERVIELEPDADFLTKRFTERAVKFIKENGDEPFFLYVPHPIPHRPLHMTAPYLDGVSNEVKEALAQEKGTGTINYDVRDKLYFRAINEIDWSVGQILDALVEQGIDDNTIVIFTSDNGQARPPVGIGSAGPLKGSKGTTWEGGLRVPTVIRWPGKIAPGSENDELLTAMDLLPTFAKLAGAEIPTDRVIDGKDIWPVLTEGAASPHEVFFYHRTNSLQAVRAGKWKLQTGGPKQHGGGKALFDLEADIGETTNVRAQHPEIAARLRAHAVAFNEDLAQNSRPAGIVKNPKALTTSVSSAGEASKPNIVVIFADDLGYGDLGCYGAKYKTPALDQMATEGLRSTDFIVPANVCSPSRSALLTGRYPMRNGHPVYRNPEKTWTYGLHPDEITIAELLKTAGYRSLAVGKWHLGFRKEGAHPMDAGFDAYYGLPYNYSTRHDPWNMALFRDREMVEKRIKFPVVTARYTEEVVKFIEQQSGDQPFFLYLAHQIAHTPIQPSKPFKGLTKKGVYADFVTELDHSTGRVLKALRKAGLDENTLVIFLADNGHTGRHGSGGPLAGGKYTTMEGGHRVPAIFRWTSKIPAGQVSDATMTSMDFLPLFCDLAGVDVPADRKIDGANIIDVLLGKTKESPHEFLYYYNGVNLQAVRKGKWKLHLPRTAEDQPYWGKGGKSRRFYELEQPFLVNLKTDIGEKNNVAADNPEVLGMLLKEADRIRAELGDVGQSGNDQRPGWPPAK